MGQLAVTRKGIALWLEAQAFRLTVGGLSQKQIAQVVTEMGRGIRPGRLEGIEYPPDYGVTDVGVLKAFRRYCQRNPVPGLAELRRVDTQRCEDIFRSLLPTIAKGGREGAIAADAAVRALAHKARINGLEAPVKVRATDAQGRTLTPIPIETVRKIMEGGEVIFDAEPNIKQIG